MKKIVLLILSVFILVHGNAQEVSRPQLVVGIVLDQMRWDYLYRFYPRYGEGGFKRLMNEGFNCQNTYIDYLPSFTAPGHACVYTGSVPALHGISGNDWMDLWEGRYMYCTEDASVQSVGGGKEGMQSPKNLLASTVSDELKLATRHRSRVFGVAIKDRGAVLPAGHFADAAFWLESTSGNFISSTFYLEKLPQWLEQFNKRGLVDSLLSLDWYLSYPAETYLQSNPDDSPFEGKFGFEDKPVFPHLVSKDAGKRRKTINSTPQGNTLTRMMAEALIAGEQLGQKKHNTDFLAVSFSSPDYIGHLFGPDAMEVEDMYLKMDQELALLLNYLDKHIGKGQYTLFLTADHAGAHNPGYIKSLKGNAGSFSNKLLRKEIKELVAEDFDSSVVLSVTNYQIFLNDEEIQKRNFNRLEIVQTIKKYLQHREGVAFVLDMKNINNETIPEVLGQKAINGYHPMRSGDIQIIMNPAWYLSGWTTGTTHGSWAPYDAHIPLLWYGWGIPQGESYRKISMTDIAPTLSALLKIQEPNANIGQVITEIVERK